MYFYDLVDVRIITFEDECQNTNMSNYSVIQENAKGRMNIRKIHPLRRS